MAEIINLRRVRKRLDRDGQASQAAENRVRHGRTRAERAAEAKVADHAERVLDGARLEGADQAGTANRAKERDTVS